jgi:hypothetical protein
MLLDTSGLFNYLTPKPCGIRIAHTCKYNLQFKFITALAIWISLLFAAINTQTNIIFKTPESTFESRHGMIMYVSELSVLCLVKSGITMITLNLPLGYGYIVSSQGFGIR